MSTSNLRKKNPGKRSISGSFTVLILVCASLLILPLGLFGFEVARAYLAFNQLRSATDAAALAGANFLWGPGDLSTAERMRKLKGVGLWFVKQNHVISHDLQSLKISESVDTDNPGAWTGAFDLVVDQNRHAVIAKAVLGLEPAFGKFLGIGTLPVHARSVAGGTGMHGDIAMIVDLSGSMTFDTKSVIVQRTVRHPGPTVTYNVLSRTDAPGTFPYFNKLGQALPGGQYVVPAPNAVALDQGLLLNKFASAPDEVKVAAMLEAKLGHLESKEIFERSGASSTILSQYVTPQAGWQDDFQRVALAAVEPLNGEKLAVNEFTTKVGAGNDVHFGLVTYSDGVSRGEDKHNDYKIRNNWSLPRVGMNGSGSRTQDVIEALSTTPALGCTNTAGAIDEAVGMLTRHGHEDAPKTIVLITDGMPNRPLPNGVAAAIQAANRAGNKGVKIYTVGFFHTDYSRVEGPKVLRAMVKAAGNGSVCYTAPDTPSLGDVLNQVSQGDLALING